MRIRKLAECPEFVAGDGTRLRELLHPARDYPFAGRYSLAHAVLPLGGQSIRHCLATDEVYVILAGRGRMHIDSETAEVGPFDLLEIPPGARQWIENIGDTELVFLCLVDPAWRAEDERILP